MKFNETMIYRVLSIPGVEWDKSCGYIFALKIPIIILMMIVGIPIAVVIDFFYAALKIDGAPPNSNYTPNA